MSKDDHHATAPEDRIPLGQKFAYGLGSVVNNLLGGAIGYMSIVLNVGLGMNPALVGTLQAIPRFTDALTDPVMGYISDNTRSRFGRRRPYIFAGAICVGLVFALMWQLPWDGVDLGAELRIKCRQGLLLQGGCPRAKGGEDTPFK